jgi:Tol biopolymer transport system component
MGEVYRAHDTRLDRAVAIKVLPERLSENADSLARFEREARAVAALSHPNILSIFDFGAEGGRAYAAMELLEGQTLRERLAEGPVAPRKAAEIGAQIAHGLAAAHEKGIVHRDLKPENVFLTRDGRAKILDFGLARTEAAGGSASQLAAAPTVLPAATDPGTVLGTAAYMSPEQVRGEVADARSDLFSFGAVFYELLSGQRAFQRETAAETMTAILREEPVPVETRVANLPPVLERVVRHCLEKNPQERFQSARDLAFALDVAAGGASTSGAVAVAGRGRGGRRGAMVAGLLAAAGIALGFLAGRLAPGAGTGAEVTAPVSFTRVTETPGVETEPSLSPDGKSVVYSSDAKGKLSLCLLRIGSRIPVVLTADSPADDRQPAFSPDGERIAFRSEREGGGIFLMSSTGESVRRLTDFGYFPSWSPDGRELVVSIADFQFPDNLPGEVTGLWVIDVDSGARRAVLLNGSALQPAWSPHGKRIAYWGIRHSSGQRDLWTVAADGSEVKGGKEVTRDPPLDWSPAWAPDGRSLYFSSNRGGTMNLWRVPIDEDTGQVRGAPTPVTTPSVWSGRISFSRDGRRFAYASLDWRTNLMRVPFDPQTETVTGMPFPLLKGAMQIRDFQFSPDGQWVAFSQASAREDLLVSRVDGTEYRRLTDEPFRERAPTWSPDGQRLVFYSDRSGTYQVWTINVDGSRLERVVDLPETLIYAAYSPDGRQISAVSLAASWLLIDLQHGTKPTVRRIPSPAPGTSFWPFNWSPDGKRVAGDLRHEDGSIGGLALYDFASAKYTYLPSAQGDSYFKYALWLNDGIRLLVRGVDGVSIVNTQTGSSRLLIPVRGYFIGMTVGISRDNRSITYNETGTEGDIWIAEMAAQSETGPGR